MILRVTPESQSDGSICGTDTTWLIADLPLSISAVLG